MTESRRLVLLLGARGAAAVVFGVLTLVWPQLTVLALAWVFGAYALVDGAVLTGAAWRHRRERWHGLAYAAAGVLGIVVGLMTAWWPGVTALALMIMIGAWAVLTGGAELWAAVRLRHQLRHAWFLQASGAVSVVAGALLWLRPDAGAVAIALVLGVYALITGGIWLAAAWREYRKQGARQSQSWTRPTTPGARVAH
ncbi:HdeD family acid-resistance protein [Streptomyces sp. NPDC005202]|uniref:HdeD family acid-resistance protein n=1 Tax=Streptomyces sp. NPDC005202 TaxID=3157021 RepID=UPI0033A93699